jgi:hypothetical protein
MTTVQRNSAVDTEAYIQEERSKRRRRSATSSSWSFPPPRTRSATLLAKKNKRNVFEDDDDDKSLCSCSSQDFRFPAVKSTYPTTRMIFEEDQSQQQEQSQLSKETSTAQSTFTEGITPRIGSRYQADIPPFLGKKSLNSPLSPQTSFLDNRVWIPALLPDDLQLSIVVLLKEQNNEFWNNFIGHVFPVSVEGLPGDDADNQLSHSSVKTKKKLRFFTLSNVDSCEACKFRGKNGVCFVTDREMSFSEVGGNEVRDGHVLLYYHFLVLYFQKLTIRLFLTKFRMLLTTYFWNSLFMP